MKQLGKYKIIKELGSGGFGAVYLAKDPRLGQEVAIKLFKLKDEALASAATSATADAAEVLKERFLNEARILRTLSSNPYIVDLYEFDELEDGTPYYVMPYLEKSLVHMIGRDVMDLATLAELPMEEHARPLPLNQAIIILRQLLLALKDVHQADLVHRDIKPANILFNAKGEVQLADFGIAKMPDGDQSMSGVGMGSRRYMSPEQRESAKHVDASSDIFSFGVLAYRMITGSSPQGRYKDPKDFVPLLGQQVNDLIITCMNVAREDRPHDAGVLLKLFDAAIADMSDGDIDEASSTDIESPVISDIRSDLRPLRDRIQGLLLEHGEVPASEWVKLKPLAAIVDLDEEGLHNLIAEVTKDKNKDIRPLRNFLGIIDQSLDETGGNISEDTIIGLVSAGETLNWDEERVRNTIKARTKQPETTAQPDLKSPPFPTAKKPRDPALMGRLKKGVAAIALIGSIGFGLTQWRGAQEEAAEKHRIETEMSASEGKAWDEVSRLANISGYEGYVKAWPKGSHISDAKAALSDLKETARLASLNDAERQKEQIKKIQHRLLKLGYAIPQNGIADIRTKKAIEAFEKSQKLLVTGTADSVVLTKLDEEIIKRDRSAWSKAKKSHTERSYNSYARNWPQGRYSDEVKAAKIKAKDDNAFSAAKKANSIAAYQVYISKSPKGHHISQARTKMAALEQAIKTASVKKDLIRTIQGELMRLGYKTIKSKSGSLNSSTISAIKHFEKGTKLRVKGQASKSILAALKSATKKPIGVGETFTDCYNVCPDMVVVPSGRFRMGDIQGGGSSDEKPVHSVTIPDTFAVGKYEVTFAQWDACVSAGGCSHKPSDEGWGRGSRPVINVSWNDTQEYIKWISKKTGYKYRLPSEAEWEYVARAGSTTKYPWGNNASHEYANYGKDKCCSGLASGRDRWVDTSPVGSFPSNKFGLYDLQGNVWEWVEDCWNDSYSGVGSSSKPRLSGTCSSRVLRGGSWNDKPRYMRSADRIRNSATLRYNNNGFRLARTLF
jgi:serine/threonine-protein kinase